FSSRFRILFGKLQNSQMSTRDKSGLGSSDVEDSLVHDRFANVEGMHAVPPPMTGNYMPPGSDREEKRETCFAFVKLLLRETLESVPELVVVEPKVVSQPKVWSDAPIIEEYESDSDDEYVIQSSKEQEKPIFAFVNNVKHVKLLGKLFSHLIRDCDFYEKRMAKQVELNKKKGKGTSQGENRPVNTAGDKAVSAVGGKRETAVKPSAGCNWRLKRYYWNKFSKYNGGSNSRKCDNPQTTLKNKGIIDSGCSRHMIGNKAYPGEYQDYNGVPITFGGSKGYITGKDV
ncbi:hypothetical protein Tco_0866216, partial [Tanacetum coccineum]